MTAISHHNIMSCLSETKAYLESRTKARPKLAITLGSGLGQFVEEVEIIDCFSFSDVPYFSPTTVVGHKGQLVFAKVEGHEVAILQGRNHYYEGHSMLSVTFPTRALGVLGVKEILLTNSSGGMGEGMHAGDFMIITDHINLTGTNPLLGPNIQELGPRFPDMTDVYTGELQQRLEVALKSVGHRYHKGVYGGLAGPTYETPAEVRYLKGLGISAVGMSTVAEAIVARHMGMSVAGLACITNLAAGLSGQKLDHTEVTDTTKAVESSFVKVLKRYISHR